LWQKFKFLGFSAKFYFFDEMFAILIFGRKIFYFVFRFLATNFYFWQQISIFDNKFRFLTKNSIFDKKFDFWQLISIFDNKFWFLTTNVDFWQQISLFDKKIFFFTKNFDFWQIYYLDYSTKLFSAKKAFRLKSLLWTTCCQISNKNRHNFLTRIRLRGLNHAQ